MERVLRGTLLALALTIGVFVAACAAEQQEEELSAVGSVGRTSVQQVTPGPNGMAPGMMMGTPTGEVRGARATPAITGTPSPADIQATLRNMDQFRDRLRNLAGNLPTASDLMSMVQTAEMLMAELHTEVSVMSANEVDLGLAKMEGVVVEMGRVVDSYSRQVQPGATPGALTPTPMVAGATPMATPAMEPGPMTAQQLMMRIDQLRDQLMRMANGQPTAQSIINALDSMQTIIADMRQQLGTLSTRDLEALTGNLADAMNDLSLVMETYLRQTGTAPTMTPTTMPSPTPSPSPTLMPSPTPIPSPTPVS